jgi:hypothetical protein
MVSTFGVDNTKITLMFLDFLNVIEPLNVQQWEQNIQESVLGNMV